MQKQRKDSYTFIYTFIYLTSHVMFNETFLKYVFQLSNSSFYNNEANPISRYLILIIFYWNF